MNDWDPALDFFLERARRLSQDDIDALCREVQAAGLPPNLEANMRGILEGVMIDLGYQPKSVKADAKRLVHRLHHNYKSPELAARVEIALEPAVYLADFQWIARQRHLAAFLGLLQWQVDKPPPPTLWERL